MNHDGISVLRAGRKLMLVAALAVAAPLVACGFSVDVGPDEPTSHSRPSPPLPTPASADDDGGSTVHDAGRDREPSVTVNEAGAARPDAATGPQCDPKDLDVPLSACLDDVRLRWYDVRCSDAGAWEYKESVVDCPDDGLTPRCQQGHCQMVVLR